MSTPEFKDQFRINMENIARWAGFMPTPPSSAQKEEEEGECPECWHWKPVSELDRNGGVCDDCVDEKYGGNHV